MEGVGISTTASRELKGTTEPVFVTRLFSLLVSITVMAESQHTTANMAARHIRQTERAKPERNAEPAEVLLTHTEQACCPDAHPDTRVLHHFQAG